MSKAFNHIPATSETPLFVFGDHASKHIPETYKNLGLSGDDLTRHIAWDIGTETIIRTLCAELGCAGQVASVSRLVIDLNRDPDMDSLIPAMSDGSTIPRNQDLSAEQRLKRMERYYAPYHAALGESLDQMGFGLAVSVHSFTPQLAGQAPRELEIGLLVKDDEISAELFKAELAKIKPDWRCAVNEPYSAYDLNYTVDTHVGSRGLPHISVEFNQSLIDTEQKAVAAGQVLARALAPLIYSLETAE